MLILIPVDTTKATDIMLMKLHTEKTRHGTAGKYVYLLGLICTILVCI